MKKEEIFLKENLKFLRKRKKLTQQSLAKAFKMSREKLSAIELGITASPSIADIVMISRYFKIATDTLLTVNLATLGEHLLNELEYGSDVYMTGKRMQILAITQTNEEKVNVAYVPVEAQTRYFANYSNPEYLATLPKFTIPALPLGYIYRMFSTYDDSMLPIPEGSDILAKYVRNWINIKPGTLCIVILKQQKLVFKQVTITSEGLLLHAINKLYEDYRVEFSDILEIWEYYSFHSRQIPETGSDLIQIIKEIRKLSDKIK